MMRGFVVVVLLLLPGITNCWAQYWTASPFTSGEHSHWITFSNDDKRVYYISGGAIYGIDLKKKDSVLQIVPKADAPVVRMMHIFGKPQILFMRASAAHPTDYHLYRMTDDGKTPAEDLTPSGEGVQNIMLGMAYNGRYLYYSSNKRNSAKNDYYRYDILQNMSELIVSNDKQYELMGWARDQMMVLLKEPSTSKLKAMDIQTTEQFPFYTPSGTMVKAAGWSPDAKQLLVVEEVADGTTAKLLPMTSVTSVGSTGQDLDKGAISRYEFSVNGKYIFETKSGALSVKEAASKTEVPIPQGTSEIAVNGKETLFLALVGQGTAQKLQVMDAAKKTVTDIGGTFGD